MFRLIASVFLLLSVNFVSVGCAGAQTRQRRSPQASASGQRTVNSSRFAGANPCAKIQAAIDSLGAAGGTVLADAAGDCGNATQVRVKAGVTLRLPPGTFSYSMRGYGGAGNTVGALFVIDSDATLEGSGPETVIRESSWVHTRLDEAGQRGAVSNGEYIATFKVIMTTAGARNPGSTARNVTVRNLTVARGKPDGPGSFNSVGGALDLTNCHGCLIENVHMNGVRSIGIHVGGTPFGGDDPGLDLRERGVTGPLGRFAKNVTVRNCTFRHVASQNLALVNGEDVTFVGNKFYAPGQPGGPGSTIIDLEANQTADRLLRVRVTDTLIDFRGASVMGNGLVVNSADSELVGDILFERFQIVGGGLEPIGPGGQVVQTRWLSNGAYALGPHVKGVTFRNGQVERAGQSCVRLEGHENVAENIRCVDVGGGGSPGARILGHRNTFRGNTFVYTQTISADSRILYTGRGHNFARNEGFGQPEESN